MAEFQIVAGDINKDAWVVVINESDWTVESATLESIGAYEIYTTSGTKTVVTTDIYGEAYGYGAVIPAAPPLPTRTGEVWISGTATPLSVTLNTTTKNMIDGNYSQSGNINWGSHASFGVDFGKLGTIHGMDYICWLAYGDPDGWNTTSSDSIEVYKSDDNITWTLVQRFDAPEIISHSLQRVDFRLYFNEFHTARYFTAWNAEDSYLAFNNGTIPRVAEIEVFQQIEGE